MASERLHGSEHTAESVPEPEEFEMPLVEAARNEHHALQEELSRLEALFFSSAALSEGERASYAERLAELVARSERVGARLEAQIA